MTEEYETQHTMCWQSRNKTKCDALITQYSAHWIEGYLENRSAANLVVLVLKRTLVAAHPGTGGNERNLRKPYLIAADPM